MLDSINVAATSFGGEAKGAVRSPTEGESDVIVVILFSLRPLPFGPGWLASEANDTWLVMWHTGYLFPPGSVIAVADSEI